MEWSTTVLILGVLVFLGVLLVGGKAKVTAQGVEIDTKGFLEWLARAREQKNAAPPAGTAAPPNKAPDKVTRIPSARVLWVDDHPLNNLFERQALASLGIFADSYSSNSDGVAAMAQGNYDLVISDQSRGDSPETGWDLLRTVRERWPATPFLFYVGNDGAEQRSRAQRENAQGLTANPDELMRLVSAALAPGG